MDDGCRWWQYGWIKILYDWWMNKNIVWMDEWVKLFV